MKRLRTVAVSGVAALVGCGAAFQWQESCGCAPLWPALAQELNFPDQSVESSITAQAVAEHMAERLKRRDQGSRTLDAVRSVGPLSENSCFQHIWNSYRCVYWLWRDGSAHRGIQLDIQHDARTSELHVTGAYIVERTRE